MRTFRILVTNTSITKKHQDANNYIRIQKTIVKLRLTCVVLTMYNNQTEVIEKRKQKLQYRVVPMIRNIAHFK